MGRRIGDYIHYKYENYKRFGTSAKREEDGESIGKSVFSQQKDTMRDFLNMNGEGAQGKKQYLETVLNAFYDPSILAKQGTVGITAEDYKEIRNMVQEVVMDSIKNANKYVVDWNTLQVSTIEQIDVDSENKQRAKAGQQASENLFATWGKLKKLYDVIDLYRRDLIKTGGVSAQEFIDKVEALDTTYRQQVQDIKKVTADSRKQLKFANKANGTRDVVNEDNLDFVKTLNSLYAELQVLSANAKAGELSEKIAALMTLATVNATKTNLKEILQEGLVQAWTGTAVSQNILIKENFIRELDKDDSQSGTLSSLGGEKLTYNYTADKVDAILSLSDTETINATIKNYNFNTLRSGLHLLSGTSLLKYIQEFPDFANHYFNTTAFNTEGDKVSRPNLRAAHEAMRMTLAAYALGGGQLTRKKGEGIRNALKAEVLVLNSRSSTGGKFSVIFTSDILARIAKNVTLINIEGYGYIEGQGWRQDFIGNPNEKSMEKGFARIAKLLADAHKMKLNISLDKAALFPT